MATNSGSKISGDLDGLLACERRLHAAQRTGDVPALDGLLHDDLVAIGPDGARFTKQDDLDSYRAGTSVIDELIEEAVEGLVRGSTGVTFFVGTARGSFAGEPFSARLRYTRTWLYTDATGWLILAAHISASP